MSRGGHGWSGAGSQLPALIHEAELGEPVEITRHGHAVAIVLSFAEYHRLSAARPDLWAAYQGRERRRELTDEDIDALADPTRAAEPNARVDW